MSRASRTDPPGDVRGVQQANPFGLEIPDGLLDALAERVADHLADRVVPAPAAYLTVEEAAEYLRRPRSRIYDLVAAKRLRHRRDGRTLLFRHEDLDGCLDVVETEGRAA
jgi:excisionase family DNA binding protein